MKSAAEVSGAVTEAADTHKIGFFLIDAPAEAFKSLAAAAKGRDVLLFNVSAPEDTLRRDLCAREFVHVIPSLAMRMDGLVQYLVSRKWRDVLVFEGPAPADAETVKALTRSVQKFGARIIADQKFKPGTDPREREQNDPLLLSALTYTRCRASVGFSSRSRQRLNPAHRTVLCTNASHSACTVPPDSAQPRARKAAAIGRLPSDHKVRVSFGSRRARSPVLV